MRAAVRFALFCTFLVLVGLCRSSRAADWPAINPDDLKMTAIPEQPGAAAAILDREEIDDDLNNFHATYQRIKIFTEAGRGWANVEVPYLRRGFSIADVSGRTVHADGTVIPFEGKPFDKAVVRGSGVRVNVKSFTLPDVQVGSIIEYRYTLRYEDHRLLPPEWEVQTNLFQRKAYFKFIPFQNHGNMYIQLAHNQIANGIAWTPFLGNGPQPQKHEIPISSINSSHTANFWVDLDTKNIPALVEEPFMPPAQMMRMRVYFYYQQALKVDDYWKSEGKFWNKDVENFLGKTRGISDALAKTITPSDTAEQKVHKIYAFVSHLENQDYVPQRSKQENKVLELAPNKGAEDVLEHGSGTHDELNRLFVAMVRQAGIPACLIWVPNRSHDVFIKEYMSTSQLDAEIAIVQLGGKDVFLDPGTKFAPYGIVDWRYTGVGGLRQGPQGAEFAKTDPPLYSQSITTRLARVSLDQQGVLTGTVSLAYKGDAALWRRQEGGKTDAEGRKKMLEEEVKTILPGNAEVSLTNSPDWDNAETSLIAQYHVSFPFAVAAGKRLMLQQHLFQVNEKARFSSGTRSNAVYFHVPWQEADEVHLTIPSGMEVETLAPDDTLKLNYALYQARQKQEAPNQIYSRRDFIMGGSVFTVDDYKELKGFFDKVKSDDDQPALVRLAPSVATTQ